MSNQDRKPRIDETEYDKLVDQDFIESFKPRTLEEERQDYDEMLLNKDYYVSELGIESYEAILESYEDILGIDSSHRVSK